MSEKSNNVQAYIDRVVSKAPLISPSQAEMLRSILASGHRSASAVSAEQFKAPERHALYRHYDAGGSLLYVGISVNLGSRTRDHRRAAPWVQFVDRTVSTWFPTRQEALEAERSAIQNELPLFNKHHSSPERDERLLAYLIEHNATALLRLP
jgi:hypothetical protein